jgi:vacuolar-type H+-ATPase subunit F/Vma7
MKIAVIGSREDVAGFALAGVEEGEDADEKIAVRLSDDCVVVIDADDR